MFGEVGPLCACHTKSCNKCTFKLKNLTKYQLVLLPELLGLKPPDSQLQGGCVGINNDLQQCLSQEDMHLERGIQ